MVLFRKSHVGLLTGFSPRTGLAAEQSIEMPRGRRTTMGDEEVVTN